MAVSEDEVKKVEDARVKEIIGGTNESKTVIDDINIDKKDLGDINENTSENKSTAEVLDNNEGISNTNGKKTYANNTHENIKDIDNIDENEQGFQGFEEKPVIIKDIRNQVSPKELNDRDIILSNNICTALDSLNEAEQYEDFKPQKHSTSLSNIDITCTLKDLELVAGEIADDILKSSLEFENEVSTTPVLEIFEDPTTFDFLSARGNSQSTVCQRNESLYIKFDPLLNNFSMLPQESGKVFSTPPSSTIHKLDEIQENNDEPIQVSTFNTEEIKDTNITNVTDLKLLYVTVLQLKKALVKQKKEFKVELEQLKVAFEENLLNLQTTLSKEIENKNQLTVVVDEYKKLISQLLTEKRKDHVNLEQEKAKLRAELQTTNHHLSNAEDAFSDVHLKYERLKEVVAAYKSNEGVLRESIQENLETIKSLENRYEQLKTHAMSQLRQANFELVDVRKQHEVEMANLNALVRKAELKSNSLAEVIKQKKKKNKELIKILDELIARVSHQDEE